MCNDMPCKFQRILKTTKNKGIDHWTTIVDTKNLTKSKTMIHTLSNQDQTNEGIVMLSTQMRGTQMMTKIVVGEEKGHAMFLKANKHLRYQTTESENGMLKF